jgi:cupin fold WbuC family metalloprotein
MESVLLSEAEIKEGLLGAKQAERRRYPKVLHQPGADFNRMINFLMSDTYMQPHFHPHQEKIEGIEVIQGKLAVLFFNDEGEITKSVIIENKEGEENRIDVPGFAWHTYIVLSETAVTYETMKGVYDPKTWKELASWAPLENTPEAKEYLSLLKKRATG